MERVDVNDKSLYHYTTGKKLLQGLLSSHLKLLQDIFVPVAAYIQSSNVAANITEDHKNISSG